ncbi:MAG TPA: twin-arginine translocation signal domain-containing protein, partial [Candidatus Eremiobacteraceae bacterium]|nr:twin-arginine translocation signal domain-containing protein [Candidatus Eremiobacteraceae bacterium]
MSEEKKNRELGMKCPISRRDFLNGVAIGMGGALAGETLLAAGVVDAEGVHGVRGVTGGTLGTDGGDGAQNAAGYYPPALTGMRGNH